MQITYFVDDILRDINGRTLFPVPSYESSSLTKVCYHAATTLEETGDLRFWIKFTQRGRNNVYYFFEPRHNNSLVLQLDTQTKIITEIPEFYHFFCKEKPKNYYFLTLKGVRKYISGDITDTVMLFYNNHYNDLYPFFQINLLSPHQDQDRFVTNWEQEGF